MITLVDGPRNVGKSFLLKELAKENKLADTMYKFDVVGAYNVFNYTKEQFHYVSIGNTMQFLQLVRDGFIKNIVKDRSFLSDLVYADMHDRVDASHLSDYILYLKNQYLDKIDIRIIIVDGINPNHREKDAMDTWDYNTQSNLFNKYACLMMDSFEVIKFENKFNAESVKDFIGLFDDK